LPFPIGFQLRTRIELRAETRLNVAEATWRSDASIGSDDITGLLSCQSLLR
jgi:hypothetical protein